MTRKFDTTDKVVMAICAIILSVALVSLGWSLREIFPTAKTTTTATTTTIATTAINEPVATTETTATTTTAATTIDTANSTDTVKNPLEELVASRTPDKTWTVKATAYDACIQCCGKTDGVTASGAMVHENWTIAVPKSVPFGTVIYIAQFKDWPNEGWFVAEDIGGAIKGDRIDIYFPTHKLALKFGVVKDLELQLYYPTEEITEEYEHQQYLWKTLEMEEYVK